MKNYSIAELREMGFDDEQIAAINRVKVQSAVAARKAKAVVLEDDDEHKVPKKEKVINLTPRKKLTDADVMTFDKLQDVNDSAIVELPSFGDGTPFIARVRRPSMLKLCKEGVIPNSLLKQATSLFTSGNDSIDKISITEIYDICEIICMSALVVPTYEEVQEANLELTDEQIMAIFQYSQGGVKALENFRDQ